MTHHARALADALRGLLERVFFDTRNCVYHDDGDCEPCAALDFARESLAAYDAHQKEEYNRSDPYSGSAEYHATHDALMAENARLQASGDLVERLYKLQGIIANTPACFKALHPVTALVALEDAIDALSRAPQPDTVTEEMVEAGLKVALGSAYEVYPEGAKESQRRTLRAALTAALAVKAKPLSDEELAGAGGIK